MRQDSMLSKSLASLLQLFSARFYGEHLLFHSRSIKHASGPHLVPYRSWHRASRINALMYSLLTCRSHLLSHYKDSEKTSPLLPKTLQEVYVEWGWESDALIQSCNPLLNHMKKLLWFCYSFRNEPYTHSCDLLAITSVTYRLLTWMKQ